MLKESFVRGVIGGGVPWELGGDGETEKRLSLEMTLMTWLFGLCGRSGLICTGQNQGNPTAAQHPYNQIPAGTTTVRRQRNILTYCYPAADLGNATFSPWPPEQQACNDNTQRF